MINTRPATIEDKYFLWNLKKAAMFEIVDAVYGWDDEFQISYFENSFVPEALQIIEVDGEAIGMFEVQERNADLYLVRIEIMPHSQGHGIGSTIIQGMIERAVREGKPLRLQVFKHNPAHNLYQRLGFRNTGETETHIQMEWSQSAWTAQACTRPVDH